jgi:hypothetical protein
LGDPAEGGVLAHGVWENLGEGADADKAASAQTRWSTPRQGSKLSTVTDLPVLLRDDAISRRGGFLDHAAIWRVRCVPSTVKGKIQTSPPSFLAFLRSFPQPHARLAIDELDVRPFKRSAHGGKIVFARHRPPRRLTRSMTFSVAHRSG